MRRLPFLGLCLALAVRALAAAPAEEVRAADAARVRATIAGDAATLAALLSDHLTYGHADGRLQTKDDLLASLRTGRLKYESYDYQEMAVTPIDADAATMSGRVRIVARSDDRRVAFWLRFLAVWHREAGAWRLFAYQSAQMPAPESKP